MTNLLRSLILLTIKFVSRLFYRFEVDWVTPEPDARSWRNVKVVAMLNHTSLFEWLYAGSAPNRLLHRIATKALVPIADKTIERPLVGRFFRTLAPHFKSVSRAPDETWQAVLDNLDGDALVVILPEGRMMRANGLDKHGKPMTVRGGVADILRAIPEGTMLIAYCGGLHHVQVPGQRLPRLFKTLRMTFEVVDINVYKSAFGVAQSSPRFKVLVKADLEARRDRYCRPAAASRQKAAFESGSSEHPDEGSRI